MTTFDRDQVVGGTDVPGSFRLAVKLLRWLRKRARNPGTISAALILTELDLIRALHPSLSANGRIEALHELVDIIGAYTIWQEDDEKRKAGE